MADIFTANISFKSVGVRYYEEPTDTSQENLPLAIKSPMSLGQSNDGIFSMTFDLRSTIRQNLKNLILTNWGERIGRYFFGANLRPLTMEFGTEQFDNEVAIRIKSAVSKWMSFVELQDMQREVEFLGVKGMTKIKLKIFYSVPAIKVKQDLIEVDLYLAG